MFPMTPSFSISFTPSPSLSYLLWLPYYCLLHLPAKCKNSSCWAFQESLALSSIWAPLSSSTSCVRSTRPLESPQLEIWGNFLMTGTGLQLQFPILSFLFPFSQIFSPSSREWETAPIKKWCRPVSQEASSALLPTFLSAFLDTT